MGGFIFSYNIIVNLLDVDPHIILWTITTPPRAATAGSQLRPVTSDAEAAGPTASAPKAASLAAARGSVPAACGPATRLWKRETITDRARGLGNGDRSLRYHLLRAVWE